MNFQRWIGLLTVVLLLLMRSLLAAAKSAFSSGRRSRLHQMEQEGLSRAALAVRVADDSSRMLGTLYLGKALLAALALVVAALSLADPISGLLQQLGLGSFLSGALTLLGLSGLLGVFGLVVGRLVPEAIAAAEPERWALRLALLAYIMELLLWPVVRVTVWVSNRLAAPFGGTPFSGISLITEEGIKTLVDAGEEEGVIAQDEREMIYSIFEFGDTLVREIMVPRIDMVSLDVNTPLEGVLQVAIEAGHSRIPVYEETVDHIVGVLYAKDLLLYLIGEERAEVSMREIVREAYFVPETKKVGDLLHEMQHSRVHIALVVDEYGGTAGLVTAEDILEEIVGEIQDEYDVEEPVFEQVGEGEYILDARMDIDDANNLLRVHLPTEVGDTLGGLVYGTLGKIPAPGEQLAFDGVLLEVLTVNDRRIRKLRLQVEQPGGANEC